MYDEKNIESELLKRPKSNPFKTPDHYFDSIEDRVMKQIKHGTQKKTTSTKVLQLLKPALGLVASFSLVYMLVYYPINHLLPKNMAKTEIGDTASPELTDDFSLVFTSIDENTVVDAILSDQTTYASEMNPDEVLAYLSSGLNDLEIYSEIQK
jgi:hypothetical protein